MNMKTEAEIRGERFARWLKWKKFLIAMWVLS